jgi:enoyl-CoA hydratase/carnithine racemase
MSLNIVDLDEGIRILRLAQPPVNALGPGLVRALRDALDAAMTDGVKAIVLSGGPKVFSAGLDVPALLALDRGDLHEFWRDFFGIAARLSRAPMPIAAAIDGHSPAGGAVLALFCDTRIMARGPFKIGLNEVQVGLPVPPRIQAVLRRHVGPRIAERLLVAGEMIESEQALALGFVDALCEPGQAEHDAIEWCRRLLTLPPRAMIATRVEARRDIAGIFDGENESELQDMTDAWFSAETQATMRALVERLKAQR